MSYKSLQLSPQASAEGIRAKVAVQDRWCASVTSSREIEFVPSWMEDDCEYIDRKAVVSGLALSVVFSAGFWVGVARIIFRT